MLYEKSAGAFVFRRDGKRILFLFLKKDNFLDVPKGNVEKGEDEMETVKREAEEEAGLDDLQFLQDFREKIHYFYRHEGELISKDVVFFLAETKIEKVKVSWEHKGYEWLDYETAMPLLKEGQRQVLKKAHEFLSGGLKKFVEK
jgi:8-oxo-dGTP pyrophosphatase MutT (NUDIX family)